MLEHQPNSLKAAQIRTKADFGHAATITLGLIVAAKATFFT
jgi:hypothetical protein